MAQPIPLDLPARDARAELHTRLQNAPLEHAEALIEACAVLQELHDRGTLDLLRGALGAGGKLTEIAAMSANTPETIRGLNNLLILARILGRIEPNLLEGFARSLPEAIALTKAHGAAPPGFWGTLLKFRSKDFRRGLVLVNSLLEAFGKNLPPEEPAGVQGQRPPLL